MRRSNWRTAELNALLQTVLDLPSRSVAQEFFRDLLTLDELREFAARWKVARLLADRRSYTEIEQRTGMSSRTIARVTRWLRRPRSGYATMIRRARHHRPSLREETRRADG